MLVSLGGLVGEDGGPFGVCLLEKIGFLWVCLLEDDGLLWVCLLDGPLAGGGAMAST